MEAGMSYTPISCPFSAATEAAIRYQIHICKVARERKRVVKRDREMKRQTEMERAIEKVRRNKNRKNFHRKRHFKKNEKINEKHLQLSSVNTIKQKCTKKFVVFAFE